MNINKPWLKIGLPILVLVIAALAGYLWLGKTDPVRERLVRSAKHSEYTFGQYFNADYAAAKEAAFDHIRLLDGLSADSGGPGRNPYSVDAMSWYVRLAKLEEQNNGSAKQGYMLEACARCEQLGWADCSGANLRHQVDRMDAIAQVTSK